MTIKQCLTKFNIVILIFLITGSGVFASVWNKAFFSLEGIDVSNIEQVYSGNSCDDFNPTAQGDSECVGSGRTMKYTLQKVRLCNGNSSEDSSATCTTIREGSVEVDVASGSEFSYVTPQALQSMIDSRELSGEFDHLEFWVSTTIKAKPYIRTQNGEVCHIGQGAVRLNTYGNGVDDDAFDATSDTVQNMSNPGITSQEVLFTLNRINGNANAAVVSYVHPDTGNAQTTSYYFYDDAEEPSDASTDSDRGPYYADAERIKIVLNFPRINIRRGMVIDGDIDANVKTLTYAFKNGKCQNIFWQPPLFIGYLNAYDNSGQ